MKFLPLLWAGMWRNSSRTVLLVLQIACAFLLFGLLQGLNSAMEQGIGHAHADRLYIGSSVSLGVPLPTSMLPQLKRIPGAPQALLKAFNECTVPCTALGAMRLNRSVRSSARVDSPP